MPSFGIGADTILPRERSLNEPDGGRRKLDCMAAVHQREGKEDAKAKVTVRSNFVIAGGETRIVAYLFRATIVCPCVVSA